MIINSVNQIYFEMDLELTAISIKTKLTWDTVNAIRKDRSDNIARTTICEKYNISESQYYRIINNERWFDELYKPPVRRYYSN